MDWSLLIKHVKIPRISKDPNQMFILVFMLLEQPNPLNNNTQCDGKWGLYYVCYKMMYFISLCVPTFIYSYLHSTSVQMSLHIRNKYTKRHWFSRLNNGWEIHSWHNVHQKTVHFLKHFSDFKVVAVKMCMSGQKKIFKTHYLIVKSFRQAQKVESRIWCGWLTCPTV